MGWIGTGELIVIFILILVFFGPERIPEIARFLGKTVRDIKEASSSFSIEPEKQDKTEDIIDHDFDESKYRSENIEKEKITGDKGEESKT